MQKNVKVLSLGPFLSVAKNLCMKLLFFGMKLQQYKMLKLTEIIFSGKISY